MDGQKLTEAGLEEAQKILIEALNAHSIAIETQHSGTQYGTNINFPYKNSELVNVYF